MSGKSSEEADVRISRCHAVRGDRQRLRKLQRRHHSDDKLFERPWECGCSLLERQLQQGGPVWQRERPHRRSAV